MKEDETAKNFPINPQEFTFLIRQCRKNQEYSEAVALVCQLLTDLGYHEGAILFKATEEENIQFLMKKLIPPEENTDK